MFDNTPTSAKAFSETYEKEQEGQKRARREKECKQLAIENNTIINLGTLNEIKNQNAQLKQVNETLKAELKKAEIHNIITTIIAVLSLIVAIISLVK